MCHWGTEPMKRDDVGDQMPGGPSFDARFRGQLTQLLRWRRDVRHFRRTPVEPALLDHLLDQACLAPSVGNSQPWRFVLVESPARRGAVIANFERCNRAALAGYRGRFAKLYARLKLAGLREAPVHLAVFAEEKPVQGHGLGRATMPETVHYSVALAIHTLWLTSRACGLGVGWVSIVDRAQAERALEVPKTWRLVGYLCIGYAKQASDVPELERAGWQARGRACRRLHRR